MFLQYFLLIFCMIVETNTLGKYVIGRINSNLCSIGDHLSLEKLIIMIGANDGKLHR